MQKINNEHGIEMYWELDGTDTKVLILDSNGNYFNDLYYDIYDNDNGEEDIQAIIHTLEQTTLEEMCNFMVARKYNSLEELAEQEELAIEETQDNEYINVFNVKANTFYTFSW